MLQRLQKIIAAAGHCSRRKAEELIAAGRVTVDGRVAQLGDKADPASAVIEIDGRRLGVVEPHCYLLLHKPVGTVTTLDDPEGRRLVTDLLSGVQARVFPVGRLDINTSGLLILTNDGALANHLAHPRHEVDKTYLVRVRGRLQPADRQALEQGVPLDGILTAPAVVRNLRIRGNHTWFELTIHEGRNRQVRRMCEQLGYPVSRLARIRYAFLEMNDLEPGQYRHLTADEVSRLRNL